MISKFFIALKSYGLVDSEDKTIYSVEFSAKRIIAQADAPIATVVALLEQLQASWRYSSPEAAVKDRERLRKYADSIEIYGESEYE